jgi:hypothetical protein
MKEVSEELRSFLFSDIQNIDRLRVLLLVFKERVDWKVEMLSARLYIRPEKVLLELQKLKEKGIVLQSEQDTYLYQENPQSSKIAELVLLDQVKPVTLIQLVYEEWPARLKNFADAFKLKKKDP